MKREFLQSLKLDGQPLPQGMIEAILAENDKDVQAGLAWQGKYEEALQSHSRALEALRFENRLERAIRDAGGKNVRAITALLDPGALQAKEDPDKAVAVALEAVKKDCAYLFDDGLVPPPFASGTGTQPPVPDGQSASLADALRERFVGKG